jgi:hypothetical protein
MGGGARILFCSMNTSSEYTFTVCKVRTQYEQIFKIAGTVISFIITVFITPESFKIYMYSWIMYAISMGT